MSQLDPIDEMLRQHFELELLFDDGEGGKGPSGWQCVNPWATRLEEAIADLQRGLAANEYRYLDDDDALKEALIERHARIDGVRPESILCGEGASAILFAFCIWLKTRGISEVYYVPPLYFTLHNALKLLGIKARSISGRQPFESGFWANLPRGKAALLLTDPVWYAGIAVPNGTIDDIVRWQRDTGSLVFVDGCFQYMAWNRTVSERSALLDPSQTVRLLCPTKTVALHGFRFAYALAPEDVAQKISHYYAWTHGSASASSVAFAHTFAGGEFDRQVTLALIAAAAERHRSLRDDGLIEAPWNPGCGYFTFERPGGFLLNDAVLMDGGYFEQKRFAEFVRLNLLSPSLWAAEPGRSRLTPRPFP